MRKSTRERAADLLVGGLVGAVVGAIVAVNVVIYSGVEGGYEATIAEVFRESPVLGALVVAILLAGPVLGALAARRFRRRTRGGG